MSTYKKEFIKSIREYVFSKALTMFKKLLEVQVQIQYDDVFSMEQLLSTETWNLILKEINNELVQSMIGEVSNYFEYARRFK
jgi:hypothetical protein